MSQPEHLPVPTEEQYLNCIRCGLCLAVCPTYREILSETASPRGWVALDPLNILNPGKVLPD